MKNILYYIKDGIKRIVFYIIVIMTCFFFYGIFRGIYLMVTNNFSWNTFLGTVIMVELFIYFFRLSISKKPSTRISKGTLAFYGVLILICSQINAVYNNESEANEEEDIIEEIEEVEEVPVEVDYQLLYDTFTESLKANASNNEISLYSIEINEEDHIIDVYMDNYQGNDLSIYYDENIRNAVYNFISRYLTLGTSSSEVEVKIRFGIVFINQKVLRKHKDAYSVTSYKNINGEYCLNYGGDFFYYFDTRETIYTKDVGYEELLTLLNEDIQNIKVSGVIVADYSTIHVIDDSSSNITTAGSSSGSGDSNYNVGDYSSAYDFYYEHQDELSEDEAYEIYYDEYGED